MKEFLKRLIRFICVIFVILLLPILTIVELIKWAFDLDDSFEIYEGLGREMFDVLTFELFSKESK